MAKIATTVNSKPKVSFQQAVDIIVNQIETNIYFQSIGEKPTTINIIGDAGIGKTSIFNHIEKNYKFKKPNSDSYFKVVFQVVNTSDFTDSSDITGIPATTTLWLLKWQEKDKLRAFIKAYENISDDEVLDIIVDNLNDNIILPNTLVPQYRYLYRNEQAVRITYAVPAWLPKINLAEDTDTLYILVLDDFTRCETSVRNAAMPLILENRTVSYALPKYSSVVLTSNYDNGINNVIDLDPAQATRYLEINMKFSWENWSEWALDNPIFNTTLYMFLKEHQDLLLRPKASEADVELNPRMWTFINSNLYDLFKKLDKIEDVKSEEFIKIKNEIVSRLGRITNTSISTLLNNYLSNKAVYIPPMEDLMEKWTDKEAAQWFHINLGVNKQDYNLSLSLMTSVKIAKYLRSIYLISGNELNKKPFERFVRLYWDIKTQPFVSNGKEVRSLRYLNESHLILLANKVKELLALSTDDAGLKISSGSNKYNHLQNFLLTDEVSLVLTNSRFDELFKQSIFG
jgi:hypothetical protein